MNTHSHTCEKHGLVNARGNHTAKLQHLSRRGAFSLVELLALLALIGSLAAVGVGVVTHVQKSSLDTKLEQDVRQVNQAIRLYQAAGGNLEGVEEPQEVLDKLKTQATSEQSLDRQIMFVKGPLIDLRLRAVSVDEPGPAARNVAVYDPASQRFVITSDRNPAAIKGFVLDQTPAAPKEEARQIVFKQAVKTPWVWDYQGPAVSAQENHLPEEAQTEKDSPTAYVPPAPPSTSRALAPLIQPTPPPVRLKDYPLSVVLHNPNAPGTTRLFYRINNGTYSPYEGQFLIEPGMKVTGYATSLNTEKLYDSDSVEQAFTPQPELLKLKDNLPGTASYFDLGGPAAPGSTSGNPLSAFVTLDTGDNIPIHYQSSQNFRVSISYGARTQAPLTFESGYPGERLSPTLEDFSKGKVTIAYQAQALNTQLFVSSPVTQKTLHAQILPLAAPLAQQESETITLTPDFKAGPVPKDFRIFYRWGADPGDENGEPASDALLYTGPISTKGQRGLLFARVYPPVAHKAWFTASPVATLTLPEAPAQEPWEMGDYNVIVFTDLYNTTAVEGKSWIGGRLTNTNSFSLGRNYSPSTPEAVVVVGTSIGAGNAIHMEGNSNSKLIVTNASVRSSRPINWNGGGSESTRLGFDSQIPAKTAAMQERYLELSQGLAQVSANSQLITPSNQSSKRVFRCVPNSQGIAVFQISADSFFGANNITADIEMASGYSLSQLKGILINITGTTVNTKSSFNFTGNFNSINWSSKIVWNFSQATNMNMSAQWVGGNVLAPKACIVTNNNFRGNVVCHTLELRGTCERRPFNAEAVFDLVP